MRDAFACLLLGLRVHCWLDLLKDHLSVCFVDTLLHLYSQSP